MRGSVSKMLRRAAYRDTGGLEAVVKGKDDRTRFVSFSKTYRAMKAEWRTITQTLKREIRKKLA